MSLFYLHLVGKSPLKWRDKTSNGPTMTPRVPLVGLIEFQEEWDKIREHISLFYEKEDLMVLDPFSQWFWIQFIINSYIFSSILYLFCFPKLSWATSIWCSCDYFKFVWVLLLAPFVRGTLAMNLSSPSHHPHCSFFPAQSPCPAFCVG